MCDHLIFKATDVRSSVVVVGDDTHFDAVVFTRGDEHWLTGNPFESGNTAIMSAPNSM